MSRIQETTNNFNKTIYRLFFLLIVCSSCKHNPLIIDVSNIEVNLEVSHFEQELFEADTTQMEHLNNLWLSKYGFLYEAFCSEMIGEGLPTDSFLPSRLSKMVNHPDMREIYGSIKKEFSNFSSYKSELTEAFKHFKYYFPQSSIPKIVTFYSNFNANVFPSDTILGIGLDMYLGTDHDLVKKIPGEFIPQFIKNKMNSELLTADAMKYFLFYKFYQSTGEDLLHKMIDAGRIMYLLDAMAPEKPQHLKMGFTQKEWKWCEANELNIWGVLIKENYLYSKDFTVIQKFMELAPFTALLPKESPSMTGVWVGYKMFKNYAEKNKLSVNEIVTKKHEAKNVLKLYKPVK
ncbi:MAG: hypothetical protein ACK4K0_09180 [Flavobacteriales bacterium]